MYDEDDLHLEKVLEVLEWHDDRHDHTFPFWSASS